MNTSNLVFFFIFCYNNYGDAMSSRKVFKTLDEQISIFKEKGLIIEDEEKAKTILLRENYFFISGYRHLFMNEKQTKFISGTTFDELYAMFVFDRKVRNIFFKNLLIIENNIKSLFSYQLSKKYGFKEKEYLNPKNFSKDPLEIRHVHDVLNKIKRQARNNIKHHTATMHYMTNYGYIPLWILVKVLSFGIISEFYNILDISDKENIASFYGIDSESMAIFLAILSNYRNLCAHEDILYEHRTQRSIPNNKYHEMLNIKMQDDEYIYGKNDLFAVVIILKYLLTKGEFRDFINEVSYEIDILNGKSNTVGVNVFLKKMGFPDNWRDIMEED